ncbi:hypothetical protein VF21_03654 [Pseudogymnoascus sp. 05NY08]|nr:hypothetical protein VF21_03654 [Pseudogymnoascus sp. 05NY08]
MTSTGVKKRDSRFFATVLIQDEDEPEQYAAAAGRSHANLPIKSAPQSDNTLPAFTDWMQHLSRVDGRNVFPVGTGGSTGIAPARFQPHPQADQTRDKGKRRKEGSGYEPDQSGRQNIFPVSTGRARIAPAQFQPEPQPGQGRDKGKGRMEDSGYGPHESNSLPSYVPHQSDSLPGYVPYQSFPLSTDRNNIAPAQFQPHPQAGQARDKGKGRMEDSGYVLYQSFPPSTDRNNIPPTQFQSEPQAGQTRDGPRQSNSLPGYVPHQSFPPTTDLTQLHSQPPVGRARNKGKGRMEAVTPQSDSLPDAPQAREPTSLGRFLVRMCGKENRERLGRTITAMRRVPDGMLELAHLPWHSPDDPLVQRHIMELIRLKKNMGQVEVIVGTSHLTAQDRKKAVLYALGAIDGELNDNRFEVAWRKFRHHIKLIDLLSDPGAIGEDLAGLAILLPEGFSWIRGHETSLAMGESMEATVAGVMERVPELRQLSLELIPYGVWLLGEVEGPAPPQLKGVEIF